jgi:ABC-type branched-chain amino acid transport systems, ATPase component
MSAQELLRIENLNAWYGASHVLHGVNMTVNEGEVVSLLGRNGAGRTTTLRAIVGLTGKRTGSIRIRGKEAINLSSHKVARLGVGYCPDVIVEKKDPRGKTYYWIGGEDPTWEQDEASDFHAVSDGYVSVTPLTFELTDYKGIVELEAMGLSIHEP